MTTVLLFLLCFQVLPGGSNRVNSKELRPDTQLALRIQAWEAAA